MHVNLALQLGSSLCCKCNYLLKFMVTPLAHPAVSCLRLIYDRVLVIPSCQNLNIHAGASGVIQLIMEGKFEKEACL